MFIQVLRSNTQPPGSEIVLDFCDGSFFKSHPLYSTHPTALQLIAYFDEVEVCNPLGSHAGVQKLGYSIAKSFWFSANS